jgi:uncharacterized membrane protein YfcA
MRIRNLFGQRHDSATSAGPQAVNWLAAAPAGLLLGILAPAFLVIWQLSGATGARNIDAAVMLAIFLSATVSSIAGFAFSAIASGSILHLVDNPVEAVKAMIAASIVIQTYSVYTLRRSIQWQGLLPFLLGGVLTIPAGIHLLLHASLAAYWNGMGAFLVLYAVIMLLRKRPPVYRGNALVDAATGALGGITGGAAGFPGAFVTIWCGMRGWDKNRQRAVYQPYILAMQLMTIFGLEFAGHAHSYDLKLLQYAPATLLGAYCGLVIFKRLNDRHFNLVIYAFLLISGATLLAK